MKILVLSKSIEIYSTSRIVEEAQKRGHEVIVADYSKCSLVMEKGSPKVYYKGESFEKINAVIPRIGASVTFFGTAVLRQLEMKNVFIANGSQAIARSRDKLRSSQILAEEGLGVPKTAFAKFPKDKDVDTMIDMVGGPPLIIKLLESTQGLGVVLAETKKAAKSVVEAFSGLKANIIIQEFIAEAKGADIRAFVVDGEVVGAMKRQGKEGEFRSNIHRGGKGEKVTLTKKQESVAIKATKALGLKIAGVDMLFAKRGPLVLEVNSSPGLQGIEASTGVNIAAKIIDFVEKGAIKKRQKKPNTKIV